MINARVRQHQRQWRKYLHKVECIDQCGDREHAGRDLHARAAIAIMTQHRQGLQIEEEHHDRDGARYQKRHGADARDHHGHQQNRVGIEREKEQQRGKHQARMIAAQIFIADENAGHAQKKWPGSADGGAADIEDAKARTTGSPARIAPRRPGSCAYDRSGLRSSGRDSSACSTAMAVPATMQINDEDSLGHRPVDTAECITVEGKTAC